MIAAGRLEDGPTLVSRCLKCGRDRPPGDIPLNDEICLFSDSLDCRLRAQRNQLTACVRQMLKHPEDSGVRAHAVELLEIIEPTKQDLMCPICMSDYVVRNGTIAVHFARNEDTRPCEGSYKQLNKLRGKIVNK